MVDVRNLFEIEKLILEFIDGECLQILHPKNRYMRIK